ncbi:MAG: hypothetical protein QMD36_00910 [Candidatus Aenigmarchaeota archaeon]|nr:hypothetical protein [Candidatus Aenigmarchaeota archaeon]
MLNLSGKKAQFFVLTTVVIVGVFYTLSKYINPYSFVDTSQTVIGGEESFFENVKEKAIKTVKISSTDDNTLKNNLANYTNFVKRMASEKGYDLVFNYTVEASIVNIRMVLVSQKVTLKTNFNVTRP